MLKLRRVNEAGRNLTEGTWKKVKKLLDKEARDRKLVVSDVKLTGFSVCDKKDDNKCVKFDLDLTGGYSGEVIISAGGKSWHMGETLVKDRKTGGTKKPDMEAQAKNIMDFAKARIDKMSDETSQGVKDLADKFNGKKTDNKDDGEKKTEGVRRLSRRIPFI